MAGAEEVELWAASEGKVVVDGSLDQNSPRHNIQLLPVVTLCWDL